ncbi:MAG: aldo/keto reductase [Flavobacteriaceae bacterium]|jgi:predicted oxidoreductase|nr:aldo/keto reductase [Flavobacteriaceae bacterium]
MKPHIVIGTMRWGSWGRNLSSDQAAKLLKSCYDENLVKFDLADIYGDYTTESLFGEALKKSGIKRNQLKISTKCGILYPGAHHRVKAYDSSKTHLINSVNNSLKNLNTDYLDVLFIHQQDHLMNFNELETVLTELKLSGKVKHFGVCNFSAYAFKVLYDKFPLVTNQMEFSLIKPGALFNDTLFQSGHYHKKTQIYTPLGNYFTAKNEAAYRLQNELTATAKKYNATIDQILLAWTLKVPYKITPILGSVNIERIKEQIKAFDINLSVEDWYKLLEISRGKPVGGTTQPR